MTSDVRQWLGEIKNLQQKLEEAKKERDEAFASASNWRSLFETEAQQRRTEANLHRQEVDALKAELVKLKSSVAEEPDGKTAFSPTVLEKIESFQEHISQLQTADTLRDELLSALLECDRLNRALQTEQTNHAQTRKELTSALGDTMDLLGKAQAKMARSGGTGASSISSNGANANVGTGYGGSSLSNNLSPKTPSLERQPLDQVQFPT